MIGIAAGMLLPVLAGVLFARRVAARRARLAIVVPIAGIAAGLASVTSFALLTAGVHSRSLFLAVDATLWIGAGVALLAWWSPVATAHDTPRTRPAPGDRPFAMAVALLAAATLAIAVVWFVATSSVYPHGEWDAWAQWNLRARFFFRGFEDGTWRNAFAPVLAWSHPDYPMLVPMSVARLWLYSGSESVIAPVALSGGLAAATVATAALAVAHTRGVVRGCLAAAVLLACPSFVRYAAAQCADVAIAFYLLCAVVLWSRATDAAQDRWYLVLAGTAAALAGWSKNEGLAALGILIVLMTAERWIATRRLRPLAWVLAGAAPVLLVLIAFKLTLAPPSYFTAEQSLAQALASLADLGRLRLVATALARELWLTGASTIGIVPFLAAFVAVRGVDPAARGAARWAVAAMVLLLTAYAAAYVLTPKDLAWQLQTSLDRLVLHVVPTLTWATMTLCR